ncbi:DsbA family protein [Sphingomonas cavernae]|nr:DsbA family protein [Sphingomonas cavernae]
MTKGKSIMIAVAAFLAGAAGTALATGALTSTPQVSDAERAKIEAVVRDYILTHPEIIPQAIEKLQNREVAKSIDTHRKAIETPFASAWAGNPNGNATLAVFFDYACGFCRKSLPDIERLLKEDKNLKIVFRELPILSEDSEKAARVSLAAAEQGKFKHFHDALYASGRPSAAAVEKASRDVGLDARTVETAIGSEAVQNEIDSNVAVARSLGFSGTPSWVVGDQVLNGAVGYEALKEAIAEARKSSGD